MRRKVFLMFLSILASVCLLFGLSACGGNDVDGTYYQYKNGQIDKSLWIKLDDGEWSDDEESSGTYKVDGNTITFYVELFGENEELCDGTLENGKLTVSFFGMESVYYKDGKVPANAGGSSKSSDEDSYEDDEDSSYEEDSSVYAETYTVTYNAQGGEFTTGEETFSQENINANATIVAPTSPAKTGYSFAGWAKDKNGNNMWDFSEDKVTENITLYAIWRQKSGVLLSVDGASIEGTDVFMFVENYVDSVSLASKVVCSDDSSWRLYYDKLGQTEIPTKIAASTSGELHGGDNEFYIVVTSQDAVQVNVYTLTIHRSHAVFVYYMNGDAVLKTDVAYTGETYAASYTPDITGYTFNGWYTATGKQYQTQVLWSGMTLYAKTTANTYTVTYNENGGNELSAENKKVTYNQSYSLPTPTRTGYTFLGWYYGSTALTNANGASIYAWSYPQNITATAKWQANSYTVTYDENGGNELSADTVTVTYGSSYTLTKPTRTGYIFVGWYYEETALTYDSGASKSAWSYAQNVTVTAKWEKYTGVYTRVDVNGNADADGEYIYFGQYPQTKITNTALISTLNTAAGTLPTNGNNQAWTSYGYYISGSNTTDYMWYIDLDTDADGQDDYRGVYFTSYRPYYTTSSSSTSNSNQDNNGYTISEVYWFSYDPILWKIMKEESGNATLLCEMIIDSQQYDYDGSYSNNYAESTIRAWLNDEFYNTAFTALQKSIIVNVELDNSAATTASSTNSYACENTNDNVWLLSYQEAQAITGSTSSTTEREKYTTDYAQSQGAYTNTSSYEGRGYWWLRSAYYNESSSAGFVGSDGYVYDYDYYVTDAIYGVVPALQIRLS